MRLFVFIVVIVFNTLSVIASERGALHDFTNQATPPRYRVWLRTFGNWSQGDTVFSDSLKTSSYGLTLGVDRLFGNHWLLGLAVGENNTSVEGGALLGKQDLTAVHADLFARRTFDRFYLDVEGNFGFNEHSSQKDASQWSVNGEAGTWWNHGLGKAEPYIRFSHICWDGNRNETKEMLTAGIRYSWQTSTYLTTTVPRLYGGIVQELGDQSLFSVSSFGSTPTVFPVHHLEVSATRFFLGGGFTTSMGKSLDISFRYTAEMSSRDTSHTALLGINCNF